MKKILTYLMIALIGLFAGSCSDFLDTEPMGSTITLEQKEAANNADPELLAADVAALNAALIYCGADYSNSHNDFGYPAICLMMESAGADFASIDNGYNWFNTSAKYIDRVYTSESTRIIWETFYKYISNANNILSVVSDAGDNSQLKLYRGFCLAARAFGYLNLVQLYQLNYVDNQDKPGVPILTENTSFQESQNNPRATVNEVYTMIINDLTEAIDLLDGAAARINKSMIDKNVAYGIRARAYLSMGEYGKAAEDAKAARQGQKLLTLEEVSVPGFNGSHVSSCMWAALIDATSRATTTGIVNWPSHLSSLCKGGYTGAGAHKMINKNLWNVIPASDIRKQWWIDENKKSTLVDDIMVDGKPIAEAWKFLSYANVKFHTTNGDISLSRYPSDWIMMRTEEMLLIEAEGLAMSGELSAAITLLEDWVVDYRDPDYTCEATTPEEMQLEVWKQRRIELWGEGFALFDIMRLQKPLVRMLDSSGNPSGFPDNHKFNLAANDPILIYRIPVSEIDSNDGIKDSENNPSAATPVPGQGSGLKDGVTQK